MASIITATVANGLTQQADNSGVLQLASGTGNLVTVPSVTGTAMVSGNMPAFSAYKTSNQSLNATTETKITFDTEQFDTANCFASSRFTPNVAGYYQVTATLSFTASASGYCQLFIWKNGARFARTTQLQLSTAAFNGFPSSFLIYLNGSTDYIEIYSTTLNDSVVYGEALGFTFFQAALVRSA
jgi:hypothetical protein